jgi:hypothetical protein
MEIKSNLDELITKLQQVAERAEALDFSAALIAGLNAGMGKMKNRIFNSGKDSKGIAFGKYIGKRSRVTNRRYSISANDTQESAKEKKKLKKRLGKNATANSSYTEYEKLRLSRGRQVKYKDLELEGSLRRGITVAKSSDTQAAVVIANAKLFKIAEGQTKQISRIIGTEVKIFTFSKEERELQETTTNELLNQLYAGLFSA